MDAPSEDARLIVLEGDPNTTWGCSKCRWAAPFLLPDGTASDPVAILKSFKHHCCGDHSVRKQPGKAGVPAADHRTRRKQ
jgi:hypothetical protein